MDVLKQAAHARSAKVKPLHAPLARRAFLRLDSMAAPDPNLLGVPRQQFPRLCPARLPRYPLQTILRWVLDTARGRCQAPAWLVSGLKSGRLVIFQFEAATAEFVLGTKARQRLTFLFSRRAIH
jgi:hypothetical protein